MQPMTTKTLTLTLLLLLTTALGTSQATQKAGVQQEVTVNIDRNLEQKTPKQKTELYCLQKNLNFCKNNPTPLDIIIIAAGKGEWVAENIYNQVRGNIQVISQPTKPLT